LQRPCEDRRHHEKPVQLEINDGVIMKTLLCAAAGTAMLFAAGAAEAATVWATDVDWSNNGTVPGSNDRDNPLNALGAPDGDFLALGLTNADGTNPGFAVFSFGGVTFGAGASATAYEVTFNCTLAADGSCTYPESMEVFYGTDYAFGSNDFSDLADFTSAGEIFNGDAQMGATLIIPGTFTYIALVDTTLANFPG
jgi:hypothetical protein